LFKELKSEFLVDDQDGQFMRVECSTWLDLSEQVRHNYLWKNDLSLVKSTEQASVEPLSSISKEEASVLLLPL
jgi:hypothetical protein